MTHPAILAARYAGRPVLMLPRSAEEFAQRLHEVDARAFERPSRVGAILRKLSLRGRADADPNAVRVPLAMHENDPPPVPFEERAAYAPLYAGEVEDTGYCWSLKAGVALLQVDTPLLERGEDVCGVVYHGYDTLLAALQETDQDERVKARFIRMACPGGVVAGGLDALATYMRLSRGSAGGKPIWVYADMACSAAYWLASQADRVVASRVGLVGSIGAVIVHENWAGALEKAGVSIEAIQFGTSKTDGAWWAALSPKARADLQAEIDQCGRNFVADVTAGRPQLTADALIATQAAVYMAEHDEADRSGLALGFVDEIASEADAFAALVAQVSTPGTSTATQPAAPGGPQASRPKEQPMAETAQPNAGRKSALTIAAEKARAEAEDARLKAEAAEKAAAAEGSPEEEAEETPAQEADEVENGEEKDPKTAEEAAEAEARAISASPEAKANPGLALAAIQSGQTLEQFKASVAAIGGQGQGRLAVELAGAPRLGADAAGGGQAKPRGAAATFARNLEAGRQPLGR